jgi:hypothetical protein
MQVATFNQNKRLKYIYRPWWLEPEASYDNATSSFDVQNQSLKRHLPQCPLPTNSHFIKSQVPTTFQHPFHHLFNPHHVPTTILPPPFNLL